MATVKPFPALRPVKDKAEMVASPPYDVLNTQEAREMASGNSISFLHVNKPEIDLPPETDPYADDVYAKGRENLSRMIADGVMVQDKQPCFYLYAQKMGEHRQVGLVAAASVQEYIEDKIKKHELTREKKEKDRVRHIETLDAQVGPVFLTYKAVPEIDNLFDEIQQEKAPEVDFTAPDGIQHTLWVISSHKRIEKIASLFGGVSELYVADGHHRSAAAQIVAKKRRGENPEYSGAEPWNFFLTVIFPDDQMKILPYNRVVRDLAGLSEEEFLGRLNEAFEVETADGAFEPETSKAFGLYMGGQWYRLTAKQGSFDPEDPVGSLDAAILQNNMLEPVLGIVDVRKDERIDFVGGIRGLGELEKRVDSGEMTLAMSMHATTIQQLMAIADAGEIMPPKSTWFEPKLRSGLVIHWIGDGPAK
jgi:uncharacterized protein (DUF1015 family)